MGRGSKAVVVLFGVALLSLAGPAAGDMRAVIAGGKVGHDHVVHAAVRQVMVTTKSTRMVEDVVVPELGMDDLGQLHQRILGGGGSNSNGLEADNPACLQSPCAGRGKPYTGRGCNRAYGCQQ